LAKKVENNRKQTSQLSEWATTLQKQMRELAELGVESPEKDLAARLKSQIKLLEDWQQTCWIKRLFNTSKFKGELKKASDQLQFLSNNLSLGSHIQGLKNDQNLKELKKPQLPKEWHLPSTQHTMIHRDREFKQLSSKIETEHSDKHIPSSTRWIVITGLGGVGKTQLALMYAIEKQANYSTRIWFDAETSDQLELDYRTFAKDCHLPIYKGDPIKNIRDKVKVFLRGNSGWLAIYDNANKYEQLKDFLPEGGHILITSRLSKEEWPAKFKSLRIEKMVPDDAVDLLEKITCMEDQAFPELAKELAYLALALVQAAAFIVNSPQLTAEKYLDRYRNSLEFFLSKTRLPPGFDYQKDKDENFLTVATTWEMSLKDIELQERKNNQPKLSRNVLFLCSYLESDNIPCALIQQWLINCYPEQDAETVFEQTVGHLSRYSMITLSNGSQYVSLHRLVQDIMRYQHANLLSTENKEKWLTQLIDSISDAFNKEVTLDKKDQWQRSLLPHLQSILHYINEKENGVDLVKKLELISHIGYVFHAMNDANQQKNSCKSALKIAEAHYGPDHVTVAKILMNLGGAYLALGKSSKAKSLLERALKINEEYYDPNHVEVAKILGDLGIAYVNLGEPNKAIPMLEHTLKIKETHYGSDHVEVAKTLSNLAYAHGNLGNAKEKKSLLKRALKIKKAHYGPNHVEVAKTLGNLGIAYTDLGEPNKAIPLLERVLKIDEKYYGPDHVEVAKTLGNLGVAYVYLGEPNKAIPVLERALKIDEKYYGPNHIEVAKTLKTLDIARNCVNIVAYPAKINKAHHESLHDRVIKHSEPSNSDLELKSTYTPLSNVGKLLEEMEYANIVFNTPININIDDSSKIQLILSLIETVEKLKQSITEKKIRIGANIKVIGQMKAHLTGNMFKINPITKEIQAVSKSQRTNWKWGIFPKKEGEHNLHLTLSVLLMIDRERTSHTIKTLDRTIKVNVTARQKPQNFLTSHWRWLAGGAVTILILVLGWLLNFPLK